MDGSKKHRKDLPNKSVFLDVRREVEFNGMGDFEKHTKGVGMKLLQKWGYRGGGLGKNEQGIVAPIQTKMLPKNSGIGFSKKNKEEPHEKSLLFCSSTETRPPKDKLSRRKRKASYFTEEEEEELPAKKQEKKGVGFVQDVVFDMRGPQVRVLRTLENLNAHVEVRGDYISISQLQHYFKLLVDLTKFDIQQLDKDLRNQRETVIASHKEKEKLRKDAYFLKQQIDTMEEIASVLHQIDEKNLVGSLTLESLAESLMDLQTRINDDYIMCYLTSIACSYARPLFLRLFQGWDPLQNPTHGVELVSIWKNLLIGKDSLKFSDAASPYTQLLMEVVCPAVRKSGINTSWQAMKPEPMLKFMESWEELLPPPVLQTLLVSVIMPKLSAAIDSSWDPQRKKPIPDHSWIHQWLPMLSSWKAVLDPESWEFLMVQYIIPKLLPVMHNLQVNSANQTLDQFDWVQHWFSVIPTHHMLQLMEIFFNKWQFVLHHWLCCNPNFEEVVNWFLGWKERLSLELQANKHIRYRLNIGLKMMNEAVEGKGSQAEEVSDEPEMSLKEFIEIYAQQNGLSFKPKAGRRTQDGHQIYQFGNISITVHSLKQKVFALTGDVWSLVSLDQLLELHNRSGF